jgi:outer membrane receptor protein involved in Fe transport
MLHFFFTYEGKRYTTPIAVIPGAALVDGVPAESVLPAAALAQLGPAAQPFTEDQYFGKLDFEPTDHDRLEATIKVRNENQVENIGTGEAQSSGIDTQNNEVRYSLRWQHSGDHWSNEVLAQHENSHNAPLPINYGNGINYAEAGNNNTNVLTTNAQPGTGAQNKGQSGPAIQDDLTFSDLHFLGNHTLKMGAKYKRVDLHAADALNVNPQFYYNVTGTGTDTVPYMSEFTNPVAGADPTARSKDHQFGVYFQDDWAQNDHLTWFLGVRWDYERNTGYLDYVTPAPLVAALNSQDPAAPAGQTYAQTLAKGGVNINDFISNGHNRKADLGEIQPRLGFAFDVNADQRHVIFGGYGRSYDRDLYDYLQVEQTKSALPNLQVYWSDPGITGTAPGTCYGTPCFPWNPNYLNGLQNLQGLVANSTVGQEADLVTNNLKTPYSDQFSIGMRNTLGEWNTSATIARVISKNGFVYTLGNRYPDGSFFMNGGQPWGNGIPGFGTLIIGTNGIETKTTQLLLSAERPYRPESPWSLNLAYTYTNAINNRSSTEHSAFDQINISAYPFIESNSVPRHRFVAAGSVGLPWDFTIAAKLALATPVPYDDISFVAPPGGFPNGSNNQPAAGTPKNFFGDRSLDFQVTKNFSIAGYANLYARVDVLNVFNWYSYSDYSADWASAQTVRFNYQGNLNGTSRQLKFMVGAKF